jgi:hypothetical protein
VLSRDGRTRTFDTQFWRLLFLPLNYVPMELSKKKPPARDSWGRRRLVAWLSAICPAPFPLSRPASTGTGRSASRARCLATRYSTDVLSVQGVLFDSKAEAY